MVRRISATVMAIALAVLPFAASSGECRLKQFASMPTNYAAGGPILLDAEIDGTPAKLLVDTGSGFSFINQGFADRLRLKQRETPVFGYGLTGKPIHRIVRIDRLTLGRATISNKEFGVANNADDGTDHGPVGVFGAGYLANFDVELDPAAGRVKLFEPDHCPGNVVYWAKEYFRLPIHLTDDGRMVTEIELDGKSVRALIDTGASVTTLRLASARSLFDLAPPEAAAGQPKLLGLDGTPLATFEHVFRSLTFGDITLRNTKVIIADIDSARGSERTGSRIQGAPEQPEIYIGMPLLRRLHMFIAYSESAIYFTVAEQGPAAAQ
jgi:predicted aspartyl protease